MRILTISGSLRRGSHNSRLLRAASDLVPAGVELELYEGLGEIPAYDDDRLAEPPAPVRRLRSAVERADAVLIATPEYNHSIPGHLKNALDWISRPLAESPMTGRPAAVVGASTGMFGAVWAQAETRKVLGALGARVLDEELPIPNADEQFDGDSLRDPELEGGLRHRLEQLAGMVAERDTAAA